MYNISLTLREYSVLHTILYYTYTKKHLPSEHLS